MSAANSILVSIHLHGQPVAVGFVFESHDQQHISVKIPSGDSHDVTVLSGSPGHLRQVAAAFIEAADLLEQAQHGKQIVTADNVLREYQQVRS